MPQPFFAFFILSDCQWGCNINALDSFFNQSPSLQGPRASSDDGDNSLSAWKISRILDVFISSSVSTAGVSRYASDHFLLVLLGSESRGRHFLWNPSLNAVCMLFFVNFEDRLCAVDATIKDHVFRLIRVHAPNNSRERATFYRRIDPSVNFSG